VRRGFEVLVINNWPAGAHDAKALVRNLGYGFKLVHAPDGWTHSLGRGANFLIDQRGRVVAQPHFGGSRDLAVADRLVRGLLQYGQA
jgi:hypothetical protein